MGIWNVSFLESIHSLQPCRWFLSLYSSLHLEFHINGIIQVCGVLILFYLSHGIMLLKFTQVIVHIISILLFITEEYPQIKQTSFYPSTS